MKYILIIGDGMADNPVPELGGRTPLQYAKTPAMDALASAGELGSVLTVPEGMPAGSDTAILSIFGCDPRECYTGRAPLEAASTGIRLEAGDVAYRCNMTTFEDGDMPFEQKKLISHSAGSIEGGSSIEIVTALFEAPKFKEAALAAGMQVYPAPSFRHIAVQKFPPVEELVLTPPHDHLGERLKQILPRGGVNAAVLKDLMRLAHEILDSHPLNMRRRGEGKLPANGIWFWAQGTAVKLPCFMEQYGMTGAVISAVPLCHGIGALTGLNRIYVDGATGDLHTNYEGKTEALIKALETVDFIALHVEAPDECTHDGDLRGKLQAIEWIDSRVVAPVVRRLHDSGIEYRLLIMSDHKTLTSTRGHDGMPVPYLIYDSRADKHTGATYCEADALRGRYIAVGTEILGMLFGN